MEESSGIEYFTTQESLNDNQSSGKEVNQLCIQFQLLQQALQNQIKEEAQQLWDQTVKVFKQAQVKAEQAIQFQLKEQIKVVNFVNDCEGSQTDLDQFYLGVISNLQQQCEFWKNQSNTLVQNYVENDENLMKAKDYQRIIEMYIDNDQIMQEEKQILYKKLSAVNIENKEIKYKLQILQQDHSHLKWDYQSLGQKLVQAQEIIVQEVYKARDQKVEEVYRQNLKLKQQLEQCQIQQKSEIRQSLQQQQQENDYKVNQLIEDYEQQINVLHQQQRQQIKVIEQQNYLKQRTIKEQYDMKIIHLEEQLQKLIQQNSKEEAKFYSKQAVKEQKIISLMHKANELQKDIKLQEEAIGFYKKETNQQKNQKQSNRETIEKLKCKICHIQGKYKTQIRILQEENNQIKIETDQRMKICQQKFEQRTNQLITEAKNKYKQKINQLKAQHLLKINELQFQFQENKNNYMQKLEDLERARTTQELRFSDKYERLKINANTKIRKLREELQLNQNVTEKEPDKTNQETQTKHHAIGKIIQLNLQKLKQINIISRTDIDQINPYQLQKQLTQLSYQLKFRDEQIRELMSAFKSQESCNEIENTQLDFSDIIHNFRSKIHKLEDQSKYQESELIRKENIIQQIKLDCEKQVQDVQETLNFQINKQKEDYNQLIQEISKRYKRKLADLRQEYKETKQKLELRCLKLVKQVASLQKRIDERPSRSSDLLTIQELKQSNVTFIQALKKTDETIKRLQLELQHRERVQNNFFSQTPQPTSQTTRRQYSVSKASVTKGRKFKSNINKSLYQKMKKVSNQVQKALDVLSIPKCTIKKDQDSIIFVQRVTDVSNTINDQISTFPLMIKVTDTYISIQVIFSIVNQPYRVTSSQKLNQFLCFISKVNCKLLIGIFKFDTRNKQIYMDYKVPIQLYDEDKWDWVILESIKNCLKDFKLYLEGFYLIKMNEQNDFDKIIYNCENLQIQQKEESEQQQHSKAVISESNEVSLQLVSMDNQLSKEDAQQEWEFLKQLLEIDNLKSVIQDLPMNFDLKDTMWVPLQYVLKYRHDQTNYVQMLLELVEICFQNGLIPQKNIIKSIFFNDQEQKLYLIPGNLLRYFKYKSIATDQEQTLYKAWLTSIIQKYNQETMYHWYEQDFIPIESFDKQEIASEKYSIGHGGFGSIFQNKIRGLNVAIKISLLSKKVKRKSSNKRLIKEYWLLKNLRHQNIVQCYGYSQYENKYFIVLEYCQQGALHNFLRYKGLQDMKKKLEICYQVACALEYLHSQQICHFDIKPHNIILKQDLTPKICDFGLSQRVMDAHKPGFTLSYSSPEQMKGKKPGKYSDVWSFGMTMYFVLTLNTPFQQPQEEQQRLTKEVLYNQLKNNRKPVIPPNFGKEHPKLVELLYQMWEVNFELRPTIREVRERLGIIIENL